jgi:hypothetical protein
MPPTCHKLIPQKVTNIPISTPRIHDNITNSPNSIYPTDGFFTIGYETIAIGTGQQKFNQDYKIYRIYPAKVTGM